jgi:phage/plasmid-like protein (TIGR03299 family)
VSNRHDGAGSITAAVTPTRVVCQNTLNLALRGAQREWRVRHVANVETRIQEARAALDLTFKYAGEFESLGNELVGQTMSANAFGRYLDKLSDELHLVDRTSEDLVEKSTRIFVEGESLLDEIRQTKWAALNAVSEYFEHARKGRRSDVESQARQNWESGGAQRSIRRKALALLR